MDFFRRKPKAPPSLDDFIAAIDAGRDVQPMVAPVFEGAAHLDGLERRAVQARIDEVLRRGDPERYWPLAILAGAIVETGGDPADLPPVIYDRIASWFANAATIPERTPDADNMLPPLFSNGFYRFEQAAMAALSRSRILRAELPQKPEILRAVAHYEQRYGFTNKMLSVLDNEAVVVLHPTSGRGWICRVDGVADNFQLHTLLLDALAGTRPDKIAGTRPSSVDVAASGVGDSMAGGTVMSEWQLTGWRGLQPDHRVSEDFKDGTWIWNEGYPAEIELYEGARVILIGDGKAIQRSWNAGRIFGGMPGSVVVESPLPDAPSLIEEIADAAAIERAKGAETATS